MPDRDHVFENNTDAPVVVKFDYDGSNWGFGVHKVLPGEKITALDILTSATRRPSSDFESVNVNGSTIEAVVK